MSTLKLEPFSGLSGDMFLGLLTDLADAHDELLKLPELLNLQDELAIEIRPMNKTGIACSHIKIVDLKAGSRHHHHHEAGHGHHPHRHLKDVNAIIDHSSLSDAVKERAKAIFLEIGMAESDIHGVSIDKIHFHEVGAIDSIADVVGAAWLIEKLGIKITYCTAITTGYGFVHTEHGKLPVPAPATQKLLQGIPTQAGEIASEMVTPTGAAILRNLNPSFVLPPLVDTKIGYGPGEKDFPIPNVLRGALCHNISDDGSMFVIECNLDDSSGEHLGNELQQLLYDAGAVEVFLQAISMKKGRTGVMLSALVFNKNLDAVADLILETTSSIGVRYYPIERKILKRKFRSVKSKWGEIRLKEVVLPSGKISVKPENDDIMRIAIEQKRNPNDIKIEILKSYENK